MELAGVPIDNVGELSKFLIAHTPGKAVEVGFDAGDDENFTQIPVSMTEDVLSVCDGPSADSPGAWTFHSPAMSLPPPQLMYMECILGNTASSRKVA